MLELIGMLIFFGIAGYITYSVTTSLKKKHLKLDDKRAIALIRERARLKMEAVMQKTQKKEIKRSEKVDYLKGK